MNDFFNNVKDNWTQIAALGAIIAFLYDKITTKINNTKEKRESYQRIFEGSMKMYYSYINNKKTYSEDSFPYLPINIKSVIAKEMDSFDKDIELFKKCVDKESGLIPDIALKTHVLLDSLSRLSLTEKISNVMVQKGEEEPNIETIYQIKVAQFYAIGDELDDFFDEIFDILKAKGKIKKDFISKLKQLNSKDIDIEFQQRQIEIQKKYYQSLVRQKVMPAEAYNEMLGMFQNQNTLP